ncbi:MAG: hypothetical protein HQK81_15455 [Desulfovibrionaceae bacterium]|nr:hypothetical protein [Desulfovibrionaceae bacterium]MBF0515439.1 hypothetical protein [Desulfovibrionaceae bacterium]
MSVKNVYRTTSLVLALGLALILLGSPGNDIFKYDEVIWLDFFVRDLFSGYHLKWWNVAWNPYFFPDALLYVLLYPIPDIGIRLGCYAIAMAAGLTGFLTAIIRRLTGKEVWPCLTYSLAACTLFALVFYRTAILEYALIPVFHGGAAVLGLGVLYLALGCLEGERRLRSLWIMSAVILAGVFSDGVVLYSYVAPLLITLFLLILSRSAQPRSLVRLILAAAAAGALGFTLRDAANRFGWFAIDVKVPLTLEFFQTRLTSLLGEHFGQFFRGGLSGAGLAVLMVLTLAPLAARGIAAAKSARGLSIPAGRAMLALFTAVAPLFTALFYVVFIDREIMLFRAMSIVIVPYFLGAAFFMLCDVPRDRIKILLLVLACVVMAWLRREALVFGPQGHLTERAAFTAAFDDVAGRLGLSRGFAKPELAKLLTKFAVPPVWINQITGDLGPHHYVDNLEWYVFEKDFTCRSYDFIIETPEMTPKLLDSFGQPRARLPYRGYEIWVYDRDSDLAFRNVMKARVLAALGRGDLISSPVIRELRQRRANGAACLAESCVYVHPGAGLSIDFDPPAVHDVLEISLAGDAAYSLQARGEQGEVVQEFETPRISGNAVLRTHFFKIGGDARSGKIKTVTVTTLDGQGKFAVGHAFLYDDCPVSGHGEAACVTR